MRFRSVAIALLLFAARSFAGPVFPSRGIVPHPNWLRHPSDTTRTLGENSIFGGISRGFGSDLDRFAWMIDIGALIEFARWGESASFFGISSQELVADLRSTIKFNPRGVTWEEGFVYAKNGEAIDWQLGAIYRCRHDVDNGDPDLSYGMNEQRTLIFCSLLGRIISKPFHFFANDRSVEGASHLWWRGDAYLIKQDYRVPYATKGIGTDYEGLAYSTAAGGVLKLLPLGNDEIYLRGDMQLASFSDNHSFFGSYVHPKTFTVDGRLELGYQTEGPAVRLQLFTGYEGYQDDGNTPIPRNTRFVEVGFRLSGTAMSF